MELPYEKGNYCAECDKVFELERGRKTTELIMNNEIIPINNDRLLILKDIETFYQTHRGSVKFPAKRIYSESTIEFKDIFLDQIISKDAHQILKDVRTALSFINIIMVKRIGSIDGPLINKHEDNILYEKIVKIIEDKEDSQHIIDISYWSSANGAIEFISLNREHFSKYEEEIKFCLIDHHKWVNCEIQFTHPTEYYEI